MKLLRFIIVAINFFLTNTAILFPQNVNVGKFKPTFLNPQGSSCGMEQKGIFFFYFKLM